MPVPPMAALELDGASSHWIAFEPQGRAGPGSKIFVAGLSRAPGPGGGPAGTAGGGA